jgi:hypothetical protein
MILCIRHMRSFGRLFLAAFFLANAGFTVVLTHCTMTEAVPACCCGGEGGMMCEPVAIPAAGEHAITSGQPCQINSVIVGNQVDPTVVFGEFTGLRILKVDLLPVSAWVSDAGHILDISSFHSVTTAANVSPPPVETYVLNSTFRI